MTYDPFDEVLFHASIKIFYVLTIITLWYKIFTHLVGVRDLQAFLKTLSVFSTFDVKCSFYYHSF